MANKKLSIKILKDSEKDYVKKSKKLKGISILHSRFKAKGKFLGIELEFDESESHSSMAVGFKEVVPINRTEYGTDFVTSDGKLIILRYKMNSKGKMIVTSFEIIGGTKSKGGRKNGNKK